MPDSPQVVMIHGAGDNSIVWQAVGDAVTARGVDWLALDLPGRRDSTDAHPGSVEGFADWVSHRIVDLDHSQIVLAGHSMGSLVALEVAGRIPDRIAHLVLLCTGAPLVISSALLEPESPEVLIAKVTKWSHPLGADKTHGAAIDAHVAEYDSLRADTFVSDLRVCHEYQGAVAAARRVTAPATVVVAELDVMIPEELAAPIIAALDAPEVVVLRGVGHAIGDEAPLDTARIIVEAAVAPSVDGPDIT